jgi:hypothetical protein
MSQMGQKHELPRRSIAVRFASNKQTPAGRVNATLCATSGPEQVQQTEQALLDHFVGANEQSGWHSQAERLGGLEA